MTKRNQHLGGESAANRTEPDHQRADAERSLETTRVEAKDKTADAGTSDAPTVGYDAAHADDALETQRRFGSYELLEELARGGMGVVYKARQSGLNRIVALKMILSGQLASDAEVQRFHTEAEAAAKLDHPAIVPIFEVGEHQGQHFFSMGFVEGRSLADELADGPLPSRRAAELAIQLAEAMQYAHRQGIIHRDLKPANVLLDENSQPRITDFGLAKKLEADSNLTGTGQILGTPSYMPPEQAAGKTEQVGAAADVYALGALLYALLSGRPPFQAASPLDTLLQVLEKEPVPPRQLNPAIERDLETICLKCLQKNPRQRYASAGDLAKELNRFLNGEAILARPVGWLMRTWGWCKRNPLVAGLIAALVSSLLLLGVAGPIIAVRQTMLADQNMRLLAAESRALAAAEAGRNEAEVQKREAERQRDLVKQQLRVASAMRLAAQSKSVSEEFPVRSLLLAIEAVEATRRHDGLTMPIAHETLLHSLGSIGGRPLVCHETPLRSVAVSKDSRWLVTTAAETTAFLWNLRDIDPDAAPHSLSHDDQVLAAVFSSDSRRLFTRDASTVRMWDLDADDPSAASTLLSVDPAQTSSATSPRSTVTLLNRDRRGRNLNRQLIVSTDNRWLVAGSDDQSVRVWDLHAVDPAASLATLQGHTGPIRSMDVSADSRWLATGSDDQAAMLWDLTAEQLGGRPSLVLHGHQGPVETVMMSQDSRWLVSYSADRTIRRWDLASDDVAASSVVLQSDANGLRRMAISPDSRWLVALGEPTAYVWDLAADDPVVAATLQGHSGYLSALAFTPDGRHVTTAGQDGTLRIWDLNDEGPGLSAVVLRGHTGPVNNVTTTPDGRWLVSGSDDKTVRIWDPANANFAGLILRGHERDVSSVAVSEDGRWLVSGSMDMTARLWDLQSEDLTGSSSQVLKGHQGFIGDVAFCPDGRRLVTASQDGTLRIWEVTDDGGARLSNILRGHQDNIHAITVSADGRRLVSVSEDKTARIWDLTADDPSAGSMVLVGHDGRIDAVAISPDGRWLATGSFDKTVRIWDLDHREPATSSVVHQTGGVNLSLAFTSDSGRLVGSGADPMPRVWDVASDDSASPLELHGHTAGIWKIAVSRDDRWLVSGSFDQTARIWDLDAADPGSSSRVLRGHQMLISAIGISPDGRWVVTGSWDRTARLWDLDAVDPSATSIVLGGHQGRIGSLVISPDSRWLATGSADGTARLWDLTAVDPASSSVVLRGHQRYVFSLAISPDSRWLVTGSEDNTARLWSLDIDFLIDHARQRAGRELTRTERRAYALEDREGATEFPLWIIP